MNVLTIFNSRRRAYCNCNCEHYRTKFYFGIWCQNKVIIIIIIIPNVLHTPKKKTNPGTNIIFLTSLHMDFNCTANEVMVNTLSLETRFMPMDKNR